MTGLPLEEEDKGLEPYKVIDCFKGLLERGEEGSSLGSGAGAFEGTPIPLS